jgi:hypothetical protein
MNIQLDLIVPPIILGILMILMFNLYGTMMESQVNSRLNYDLQTKANSALLLIQEEFKEVGQLLEIDTNEISYINTFNDSVSIFTQNNALFVIKYRLATNQFDTLSYPLQIESIQFSSVDSIATMIDVSVTTVSRLDQEMGNSRGRNRAFAQRLISLLNSN